ncbi:MAG: radical SAM protein [Spirochaetaceae bacterium]|nr:radical SAM protein [Spirochaetaceae bacterium]
MVIVYPVHSGLYINLTNRCPCACTFCIRQKDEGVHGSDSLWLEHEPDFEEVKKALEAADFSSYSEIVFCGYGEPTEAFEVLKQTAAFVKKNSRLPVRLNTNGLGNLINKRNIVPEMNGLIDRLSISLNSSDAATYEKIVRPAFAEKSYPALLDFIKEAKKYISDITLTTVSSTISAQDEEACKKLSDELGVSFRARVFV